MSNYPNHFSHYYKIKTGLCLFFILLATFLSFSSSLNNDFVNWDDPEHLLENPNIRSLDLGHVLRIFKGNNVNAYRPLTILSFAVEYHFFKFTPWIYHLDNLLLHLGVTALVFVFARQVGLSLAASFLAALLFGIHPMRVESVAWVTERKDVLYAFFYMAALCQYWRYVQTNNRSVYISTLFLALFSILAKPMAVSLPLIFFLCDWLSKRKFSSVMLIEKIPYVLFIIPISLKTVAPYTIPSLDNVAQNILIWLWSFSFYIQKFLFPVTLIPIYPLPSPVSLGNVPYILALLILLSMIFLIVRYRKCRWWIFSCLFYFISIVWLLKYSRVDPNIVADRYMYLPSLGFCLFLGLSLHKILFSLKNKYFKSFSVACLVLLFSFLSIKTYHMCKIWKNSFTLWSYVLQTAPNIDAAYHNLGLFYDAQGNTALAMEYYKKALKVNEKHIFAMQHQGALYEKQGRYDLALERYNQCLEVSPTDESCYIARAMLYMKEKAPAKAFADFNKAISLNPTNAYSLRRRADALQAVKKNHLALADYAAALRYNPYDAATYNNRGILYTSINQLSLALSDFTKAIALDPEYALAYYNRSIVYKKLTRYELADEDRHKAKALGY